MTNKSLKIIPVVSSFVFFSQVAMVQAVPQGQGRTTVDRPQDKVVQKVDKWTDQAQKWAEKWKGTLGTRANEVREGSREKICTATQNKVGERWQKYYDARMNRVENLGKSVVALQNRVDYFKNKGLSTTELESDITTLQNLVDEYKTAYMAFLDALEGAKTLPCANYQGGFLPKLKLAKDEWVKVRSASQVVKDFYKSDIKPDLQALRAQLVEQNLESKED